MDCCDMHKTCMLDCLLPHAGCSGMSLWPQGWFVLAVTDNRTSYTYQPPDKEQSISSGLQRPGGGLKCYR